MNIEEVLEKKGIIHSNPEIMSGVSVFVGTRVPLQTFFDYLEGEEGLAEFINDFSYLENQAIKVLENLAKMMISNDVAKFMSVKELETAIMNLSVKELSELTAWLIEYRQQIWDRQIEDDLEDGRLDTLLDEVDAEYEAGLAKV